MAKNNTKKAQKAVNTEEGDVLDDVLSEEEPVPVAEEGVAVKTEVKEEQGENAEPAEPAPEPVKEEKGKEEEKAAEGKPPVPAKEEEPLPPPKPARPPTPRQQAFKSLQEAFPDVEEKYIQSHLIASAYNLEQAFNALLYLSDPDSLNIDDVVPTVVAEPEAPTLPQRRLTQLEEDELLAKTLDEEYRRKAERRAHRHHQQQRRSHAGELDEDDDSDIISNFVDKDLPQIKEQLSKNLEETKNKFNTWIGGWKKQYSSAQQELNNRQIKKQMRDEFDEEPEEVDLQKFHGIKLSDETDENKPKTPARNRAGSTDLYGTPKHKDGEAKEEGIKKQETFKKTTATAADDDDDFLLSD